jgi:hypothetical protein
MSAVTSTAHLPTSTSPATSPARRVPERSRPPWTSYAASPSNASPYSWATEVSQQAIVRLQDAAVEAARTLRETDDLDPTATVIEQAHKLLSGNGWLYLEQAELEKARGHPECASRIYEEHRRRLADDADETAAIVAAPPAEIEVVFREVIPRA